MGVVDAISVRSTCDRGKPACVIVNRNHQILATGYAGSPPGLPHCDEIGHKFEGVFETNISSTEDIIELRPGSFSIHCVRTIHAEINAINQAAKCGHAIDGATIYVSFTPCYRCAMSLISVGAKRVVCKKRYANAGKESEEALKKVGIELVYLEN